MVGEDLEGVAMLEQRRIARSKRTVAPPRHAKPEVVVAQPGTGDAPQAGDATTGVPEDTQTYPERPSATSKGRRPVAPKPQVIPRIPEEELMTELPTANLTLRVRPSLDGRAADLVHEAARQHGIKTSKAQLVEMLLSELPATVTADLLARLRRFQREAPRP